MAFISCDHPILHYQDVEMFRLIYQSKNKLISRGQALANDLKHLLSRSIRNNERFNITGALVFDRTNFVQVLEGEEADVRLIFDRIIRDRRHSDVVTIEAMSVSGRSFNDWSMGYAGRNSTIDNFNSRFGGAKNLDLTHVNTDILVSVMLEFISTEEKISSTTSKRIYID